jgi:preprotein translocase subunit SecB
MAQDQTPAQPQQQAAPGLQIITQYIKDLSFENPNAPESLVAGWPAPETTVQVFLGHRAVKDNAYECLVHFRVEAKKKEQGKEDRVCFIADLHYGALAVLQNIPAENHAAVMMVEVPKLLFPFAREVIANLTSGGGYPPLFLMPISFETIYVQEMQRLAAEQQAKGTA